MKLSLLQENLYKRLQEISRFVPTKPQLPILSSILLEAKEGKLSLHATDLHTGMRTLVGGKIETAGKAAIPAKTFVEYIASLQPGMIALEVGENGLLVTGERSKATFQIASADEYPPFPETGAGVFSLGRDEFVSLIERGGLAAGSDETRPILSSIVIELAGKEISAVSTDGYRLSKKTMKRKEGEDRQILLPAKALKEAARIIAKEDTKTVELSLSEELRQVCVAAGDSVFLLRIVEGTFPDYHAIIPSEFSEEILFDRDEALTNLRRAMIFSRESSSIVKLSLKKDALAFLSSSSSVGSHESTIAAKLVNGEEKDIAFNGKYVQDFLSVGEGKEVRFFMNESLKPGKFLADDDASFFYIVMPFRLQNAEQEI
jgi:DNA polymerase-3 subunit beta